MTDETTPVAYIVDFHFWRDFVAVAVLCPYSEQRKGKAHFHYHGVPHAAFRTGIDLGQRFADCGKPPYALELSWYVEPEAAA